MEKTYEWAGDTDNRRAHINKRLGYIDALSNKADAHEACADEFYRKADEHRKAAEALTVKARNNDIYGAGERAYAKAARADEWQERNELERFISETSE